jgi:ferritin
MLGNKIQDAFNKQLNAELFSSYLYLSMSAHFESQNLKGMARWMRLQAQEELQHALKFLDFINERGGRVLLAAVEGPKTEWGSPLEVFEETSKHESKVTGLINDLVALSFSEKDHASSTFLQWFVTEQVEEEASAQEFRDKLKLVGDNPVALFMIDQELGQRTPPATTATTA